MSIILEPKPFNAIRRRTSLNNGTAPRQTPVPVVLYLLFALAVAATLTIGMRDPRAEWTIEFFLFALSGWIFLRHKSLGKQLPRLQVSLSLVAIAAWGFVQAALGATVYEYPTVTVALRFAACAAVAAMVPAAMPPGASERLLRSLLVPIAWFGFVVALVSVLAYYTSPSRILWLFPSPYPDVWGPFLSRNNLAQFLELCLPVALWLWLGAPAHSGQQGSSRTASGDSVLPPTVYGGMASMILAAGIASASRAGAVLMVLETVAVIGILGWRSRKANAAGHSPSSSSSRRSIAWLRWIGFASACFLLAVLAGGKTLLGRLADPDPLAIRAQIFRSSVEMIEDQPWQGYGLGTFPVVYPQFAIFDTGESVDHAHNDWLEWTAEGGVGFAAVWLLFFLSIAPRALDRVWSVGVIAVFLHALVDYPFARLGVAVWVFFLVGAIETTHSPPVLPQRRMV